MRITTNINTFEYEKVRIVIPVVVGSSPISHPIKFKGFTGYLVNPFSLS